MKHEKFNYKTLNELKEKITDIGVNIPLSENTGVLYETVKCGNIEFPNRFAFQPMEGCDSEEDGSPGELTKRRYMRFSDSGAGIIWMEAVAVSSEARANPRQLYLTEKNMDSFKRLVENIKENSIKKYGYEEKVIMQATHSGRYSKPNGYPEPIIAYNNPIFEGDNPIDKSRIITDDEIKRIEVCYAQSAKLAREAGFDGVDVKSCHRYLSSEFLSAYTRSGEYGGSFENRTRFLRNNIASAKTAEDGKFFVTSRLNVYDGFEYPYGFGVNEKDGLKPDLSEPIELVKILHKDYGLNLIDISIGNPYQNPHVNRPYDMGGYVPDEHPLESVGRMMHCVGEITKNNPDMTVIGSGFSYLRQYSPLMAAGAVENGICTMTGFGRESFAYPMFIQDLKNNGEINSSKCCVACGKCTELMRMGTVTGCVVRDSALYADYYKKAKEKSAK